ncbi:hypothetical protein DFJ43DRAFT_1040988 [Lentinula guzmanii]|uniref:Uncharacterized protein n=1 Tax=Lentinula guzmanii TaxID=2804957 RepID=A0AA38JD06_9AGAR|nr:hypothetical protein DFJ43DRAFT_1040988 [Lentinula guzmanii]
MSFMVRLCCPSLQVLAEGVVGEFFGHSGFVPVVELYCCSCPFELEYSLPATSYLVQIHPLAKIHTFRALSKRGFIHTGLSNSPNQLPDMIMSFDIIGTCNEIQASSLPGFGWYRFGSDPAGWHIAYVGHRDDFNPALLSSRWAYTYFKFTKRTANVNKLIFVAAELSRVNHNGEFQISESDLEPGIQNPLVRFGNLNRHECTQFIFISLVVIIYHLIVQRISSQFYIMSFND